MCTMIVETAPISGCGKGTPGWIKVDQVNVSFDHPFHAPFDHALNIDFVDSSARGPESEWRWNWTPNRPSGWCGQSRRRWSRARNTIRAANHPYGRLWRT